jgi:hypothetical protein
MPISFRHTKTRYKGTNMCVGTCDVYGGTIGPGISAGVEPGPNRTAEGWTHVTEEAGTRPGENE